MKVRRRLGGMDSGIPNAPARLSSRGCESAAGRMKVTMKVRRRLGGMDSRLLYASGIRLATTETECRAKCAHPRQISIVHEIFTPSQNDIIFAEKVKPFEFAEKE